MLSRDDLFKRGLLWKHQIMDETPHLVVVGVGGVL